MDHPGMYPTLTNRVSGYAMNFVRPRGNSRWTGSNRTFHEGGIVA